MKKFTKIILVFAIFSSALAVNLTFSSNGNLKVEKATASAAKDGIPDACFDEGCCYGMLPMFVEDEIICTPQ